MDNGKSKENRRARGRRRNSKKEDNRECDQTSEEPLLWSDYSIIDSEDTVGTGTVERGLSPNSGNVNGDGILEMHSSFCIRVFCSENAFSGESKLNFIVLQTQRKCFK